LNSPTLTILVFAQNEAVGYGGAIYSDESDYDMINCTFYGNKSNSDNSGGETGGAIYNNSCDPNIINSIFREDQAFETPDEIVNSTYSFPNIMFCDIQGATVCDLFAIINGDPEFISNDPDGADNDFGTADDGLRLSVDDSSPCIDKADGDLAPMKDIVYFCRGDVAGLGNGTGTPDYADIGAYEAYEVVDIVVMCWTDESVPNYLNGSAGQALFESDLAAFDDLIETETTNPAVEYNCMLGCYAPLPSGQGGTYGNLGDIFYYDYFDPEHIYDPGQEPVPSTYTLETDYAEIYVDGTFERSNPTLSDFTDAFEDLVGEVQPDYIILTEDTTGSMSGVLGASFTQFKLWLADEERSFYETVTIVDDRTFGDEKWIKAIKDAIENEIE